MLHVNSEEGSYALLEIFAWKYLLGNTDCLHFEILNTNSEFIIDLKD